MEVAYTEPKQRPSSIQKAFLVCGISNNIDGSEDHMIINPTEKEDHIHDINVDDLFGEEEEQIELEGFNTNRQE